MSKCCCCSDASSLADDPRLVFSIYAIAFIPLASIYALDFITDKWRTIRDTRRNGMMQLLVSLPALGSLIVYIVLQINNRDYKEAAAAIAVAVFNSYHVLRSVWGLILLYEFRNWNIFVLRCLVSVGYEVPRYEYPLGVMVMLSKMNTYPQQWKGSLLCLFDTLKTSFVFMYNWTFGRTQNVSPLCASAQSNSSSARHDGAIDENHSRLTHETNSSSTSPGSTADGSHSHHLTAHNSFLSTLSDSAVVENQTHLFRLLNALKTKIMRTCSWAIHRPPVFLHGVKTKGALLYKWATVSRVKASPESNLSLEDIKRTVDYHMVVNSTLIDNEFSNAELPVQPVLFSRVRHSDAERHSVMARFVASCLKSKKPEECSVRWLVSFLARFGHEWLVDTRGLGLNDAAGLTEFQTVKLHESKELAVLATAHTTRGSLEDNGSTKRFMTLLSPNHDYSTRRADFLDTRFWFTSQCMLPFQMNADFRSGFDFSTQEATIRDAAKDDWYKTSLNELTDAQRSAVENIKAAQLAYFSMLIEESAELVQENDNGIPDSNIPVHWEDKDPRIGTLMYQIGCDTGGDYEQFFRALPVRKEAMSSSLWDNDPDYLLLQTSVHVDNILALECGDRLATYQASSSLGEPELTRAVFGSQYNLEMGRLQWEVATGVTSPYCCDTSRLIGCAGETVRTILATWIAENDVDADGWNSRVAPVGFRFTCSKQLCSAFMHDEQLCSEIFEMESMHWSRSRMRSVYMRLIWEVQAHLRWKVGEEVIRNAGDIRQSPFLVMLFIFGFPSLKVETTANEGTLSGSSRGDPTIEFEDRITVKPVGGPQELRILLTCDQQSERVSVIFSPESLVFKWQEWKDAFMGRLAAQKDWRLTRLSSHNELLRPEANHSDICSPVRRIALEKLGKEYRIRFWSGWPPFMPQIAQFEMPSFAEEAVLCNSEGKNEFIRALNTAMDNHFNHGIDLTTLYSDGHDALNEGRVDEALRLFWRCIAEHGHRQAMKYAFGIVSRENPVCDTQVVALETQMNVQFKSLLNRTHIDEHNRPVDKIDIAMLADYFGRICELTGSRNAGVKKALALFYENGANGPVSEKAIQAIESLIVREDETYSSSWLRFYLAIAHQSLYHESHDPAEQELAVKCLVNLRHVFMDCFGVHVGYLLEKGFFVGRDKERKNAMINSFCELEAYGDEKMLRAMFDRLFVKQSGSEDGTYEVNGHERVFGIRKRPKDAMSFYEGEEYVPKCTNRLGLLYHKGAHGIPVDSSAAEREYLVAIGNENIDALCNMGVLKCGTTGDDVGISHLKNAVEAGSTTAMNNIAVAYELENGVNRDVIEAERLYKQAIEADKNPVAMYNLAVLYMWGETEVRSDGNATTSQSMISELADPKTELEPLYILKAQVLKLDALRRSNVEPVLAKKVELEELDDCLAYVKILETCGAVTVLGEDRG